MSDTPIYDDLRDRLRDRALCEAPRDPWDDSELERISASVGFADILGVPTSTLHLPQEFIESFTQGKARQRLEYMERPGLDCGYGPHKLTCWEKVKRWWRG